MADATVVINTTKSERSSLFTRIRSFIAKQIINFINKFRKGERNIIINGEILTDKNVHMLKEIRRLNVKKLKEIRQQLLKLETSIGIEREGRKCSSGLEAPPNTPDPDLAGNEDAEVKEDADLEVISLDKEKDNSKNLDTEVQNDSKENQNRIINKYLKEIDDAINGKLAKKRNDKSDIEYILKHKPVTSSNGSRCMSPYIDENMTIDDVVNGNFNKQDNRVNACTYNITMPGETMEISDHKIRNLRPKAAKGPRRIELSQIIDMPAEELKKTMNELGYETKISIFRRNRPKAARKRKVTDNNTCMEKLHLDNEFSNEDEQQQGDNVKQVARERKEDCLEIVDVDEEDMKEIGAINEAKITTGGVMTTQKAFVCWE